MVSKDIIGKQIKEYKFKVEPGKIAEFCLAIGEDNPIYFDISEAKKKGYKSIPAPLTFASAIQFWGYPQIWQDMKELGIDTDKLLHLKEEYTYFSPIYEGLVFVTVRVLDVKVGKMNIVSFESIYKDLDGINLLKANMSIVIRP